MLLDLQHRLYLITRCLPRISSVFPSMMGKPSLPRPTHSYLVVLSSSKPTEMSVALCPSLMMAALKPHSSSGARYTGVMRMGNPKLQRPSAWDSWNAHRRSCVMKSYRGTKAGISVLAISLPTAACCAAQRTAARRPGGRATPAWRCARRAAARGVCVCKSLPGGGPGRAQGRGAWRGHNAEAAQRARSAMARRERLGGGGGAAGAREMRHSPGAERGRGPGPAAAIRTCPPIYPRSAARASPLSPVGRTCPPTLPGRPHVPAHSPRSAARGPPGSAT